MIEKVFNILPKIKYYLQRVLYWIGIAEEVKKVKDKNDPLV